MNVLVTGGTGFIGRILVKQLLETLSPHQVVCLVKRSTIPAEIAALEQFQRAGIRIIEGDLEDPKVATEAAPAVDRVFHLAANIDTAVPESALRVNDVGIEHLLRWLAPVSHGTRIMYTSSVAVHDRRGPAAGPIDESSPFTPRTAYGVTKLRGEHILHAGAATGGYTYTTVRLATVYGPGSKAGGLFDYFFTMTASGGLGGRIDWPGRTSIVHVEDVASVLIDFSGKQAAANQVFCVSNPEALTVGELAQTIGRVSNHQVRPIRLPSWFWKTLRRVSVNPVAGKLVPGGGQLAYWRLTLIIDDGFWFDTRKARALWTTPPRDLEASLRQMLEARTQGASSR